MTVRIERLNGVTRTKIRVETARCILPAIVAGYGLFILSLAVRHALTLYINPAYVWPTTAAGVLLLITAGVKVFHRSDASSCGTDSCCSDDSCGCGEAPPRLWPYLFLCVPLLLAALFPPRALQAFSANQRGLQIAGVSAIQGASAVHRVSLSVDTRSFSLQDWVGALSSDPSPKDFMDKPIVLKGMVLHSAASVPPGFIMVLRYQITCCIADARPEGLLVRDTSHGRLQDNQWVKVTGVMGKTSYQGQQVAVIEPKLIVQTKAGNPYMN